VVYHFQESTEGTYQYSYDVRRIATHDYASKVFMVLLQESIELEKDIMALLRNILVRVKLNRCCGGRRPNLGCGLAPSHESLGCSLYSSSRFGKPHFRYISKHLISGRVWRTKKGPSAVH
jgi:hypothetical protein